MSAEPLTSYDALTAAADELKSWVEGLPDHEYWDGYAHGVGRAEVFIRRLAELLK